MDRFVECHHIALDSLDLVVFVYLHSVLVDVVIRSKLAWHNLSCLKLFSNISRIVVLNAEYYPRILFESCSRRKLHREGTFLRILDNVWRSIWCKAAVVLEINHHRRAIKHLCICRKVRILHYKSGLVTSCTTKNEVSCTDLNRTAVCHAVNSIVVVCCVKNEFSFRKIYDRICLFLVCESENLVAC